MTATEFRAALGRLGISQAAFARTIEIDPRTVRRWAADGTSGGAIDALLALLERHPAELQTLNATLDAT